LWLTRIFAANHHKHTTAVVKINGTSLSASMQALPNTVGRHVPDGERQNMFSRCLSC
jgi:hypothetical protein